MQPFAHNTSYCEIDGTYRYRIEDSENMSHIIGDAMANTEKVIANITNTLGLPITDKVLTADVFHVFAENFHTEVAKICPKWKIEKSSS